MSVHRWQERAPTPTTLVLKSRKYDDMPRSTKQRRKDEAPQDEAASAHPHHSGEGSISVWPHLERMLQRSASKAAEKPDAMVTRLPQDDKPAT
ncbi:MAG: hypothetical protein HYX47_04820 [Burkholderiales bacterium]|nr:hypothetical protein [Burkholderiales bacterium]